MEKNITALFEINVPKIAKTLAKFASKYATRPQFTYICIEPERGFITATDTHELRLINIEAVGEWPEGVRILADPKHIAKIAGKTATVTVSEVNTAKCVEIEADGETYTTEHTRMNFPDVKRVIPPKESRKAIRLTPESVEALKTICKLSRGNYITLSAVEGDMRVIIGDEVRDYTESRTAFSIELATPAEQTITMSFNPALLSHCLTGSNGVILVDESYKPVGFDGEAEATVLMPMCVNDKDAEFVGEIRDNSVLVGSTFADDAAEVIKQLKEAAAELWQSILTYNKESRYGEKLVPGNYTAKDIMSNTKAKCGCYAFPYYANYAFPLEVKCGNISLTLDYSELFSTLSFWESATRSKKSVFAVGEVEEVTAIVPEATGEGAAEKKMNIDGTIRAKVLQYKQDGNTLTEKWETLKKFGDGVYYRTENEYGYNTAYFIFESDGFFFDINVSDKEDRIEHHRQEIMMYRNEFEGKILSRAEKLDYINLLEIEVMRRLGHDTDPLIASRNAYIKRREEEERKAAEDKARREQDRKEADELRKAELLADGKEKIIANKAVTVEQIELLAEAVRYKIHIRTIGFMREKVSEAVLNADETVTVWGSKLTSRNISGTADVLREIAARIKPQTASAGK